MSEETKKAIGALMGESGAGENIDWKAKYEEAERQLASAKVEQGRVKKLDEANKELQRQLDEERSSRQMKSVMDSLPEEVRDDIPEGYMQAALAAARKTTDQAMAAQNAELAALKDQIAERERREAAMSEQQFLERVEREFPNFLSSIGSGGDKQGPWENYKRFNADTINAAVQRCDFDMLAWHIRKFYTDELGVSPPSGGTGGIAPDPSNIGGGAPVAVTPGKTYSAQEISALYDEVEKARDRGDFAEVNRLGAEIDKVMREGRVT